MSATFTKSLNVEMSWELGLIYLAREHRTKSAISDLNAVLHGPVGEATTLSRQLDSFPMRIFLVAECEPRVKGCGWANSDQRRVNATNV